MPGQTLAISLVMACGVAVLVMSVGTLRFLRETRDIYYSRFQFAQVFATVNRAPRQLEDRLKSIPGVATVDLRVVNDVVLDVEGLDEPAIGRLISVPTERPEMLNRLYLRNGRTLDPLSPGEVLISEGFANSNKLQPGQTMKAIINGHRQQLRIVGTALSPEYVFQIRPGDILPDDRRFGIVWMNQQELESAFDMEGAFNSLSLTLMHDASEAAVITAVDRLLKPYGGTGAFGRDRQVSAKFLSEEIKQLRTMAFIAPSIFFGVACFLLNIVLARLIDTQREQIAALKAFGYSNVEVGWHYLQFVLLISLVGCGLGCVTGERLARGMSQMYGEFYHFPILAYRVDWLVNIAGVGLTLLVAAVATLRPVMRAIALPPAEAMRPAPPASFRKLLVDQLGLRKIFSISERMTLRELERRPFKSALSSFGISCAVSVLILGNFGIDAFTYLIQFQFYMSQRYDVSVTFFQPTSEDAIYELQHAPGVITVEGVRSVPVRLRSKNRENLNAIIGLDPDRELFQVLDVDEQPVEIPAKGLLLGDKLAEILDVRLGDEINVEVLNRADLNLQIPVTGLFTEYAGTNAYMDRSNLQSLIKEGPAVTGAYLRVDGKKTTQLYRQLKETPRIAGVAVKTAAVQSFHDTIQKNQLQMQSINLVFACIIAFGVIYNTTRISLSERSREFATLRVIGLTRRETALILIWELGILTLFAIPLGYLIGYGFCAAMVAGFESELFRIPLIVSFRTLGFAALVTWLAAIVSALTVYWQVNRLDLIGVLKSKE